MIRKREWWQKDQKGAALVLALLLGVLLLLYTCGSP
jgi:hypothetical protein